jgi:hypothetical protein
MLILHLNVSNAGAQQLGQQSVVMVSAVSSSSRSPPSAKTSSAF